MVLETRASSFGEGQGLFVFYSLVLRPLISGSQGHHHRCSSRFDLISISTRMHSWEILPRKRSWEKNAV